MSWLVSAAIVFLALRLAVFLWRSERERLYAKHRASAGPQQGPSLPVLNVDDVTSRKLRNIADQMRPLHESANKLQAKYHDTLISALMALALGFVGLSLSLTLGSNSDLLGEVASIVEVLGFSVASVCFAVAISTNAIWLRQRAKTELVRQWGMVEWLLLGRQSEALSADFGERTVILEREIGKAASTRLIEVTRSIWSKLRTEWLSRLSSGEIAAPILSSYFHERIVGQQRWFHVAHGRMRDQSESRARILVGMFGAAFLLALLKLAFVMHWLEVDSIWKSAIAFALLLLVGCSAFMTALFLNQNARSLAHRYKTQERWIEDWRTRFVAVATAEGVASASIAASVLEFEQMMIDELLDWIAITAHDKMELAP